MKPNTLSDEITGMIAVAQYEMERTQDATVRLVLADRISTLQALAQSAAHMDNELKHHYALSRITFWDGFETYCKSDLHVLDWSVNNRLIGDKRTNNLPDEVSLTNRSMTLPKHYQWSARRADGSIFIYASSVPIVVEYVRFGEQGVMLG